MIASTLSSVGELTESGSYSRALFESLSRSGRKEQDMVMLQDAKNDFMEKVTQILDSVAQRVEQGDEALNMMRQQNERMIRANDIVVSIVNTNRLFKEKLNAVLFVENQPRAYSDLHTPCTSEAIFTTKIQGLGTLFEVEKAPLQLLVSAPDDLGPISLVKRWLEEKGISYDPSMIETWKYIRILRNDYPAHSHTRGVIEAVQFFGESFPVQDYSKLWNAILDRFLQSVSTFQRILSQFQLP